MNFEEICKNIKNNLYENDKLSLAILTILNKNKNDINGILKILEDSGEAFNRTTVNKRLINLKNMCIVKSCMIRKENNPNFKNNYLVCEYELSNFGKIIVGA